MIVLPPYQLSAIVGLLLSDGWLNLPLKGVNARLGFQQSYDKLEYFWFVFVILSHYCSSLPKFLTRMRGGSINYSLYMQTKSLPCFTELFNLFYKNGVKVIPENIYDLLTPVDLAHWIAGDGQVASNGLRLCTDSYRLHQTVKFIHVLMIKFRIQCTLHIKQGKYRIYISAKHMGPLLSSIVRPYMSKGMFYKLDSAVRQNNILQQRINYSLDDLDTKINNLTVKKSSSQKRTFSTHVNKSSSPKSTLGSYLAGYFEGDGHIWIQTQIGKKAHNPRFCITFAMKNEPLAKKLLDIIGSGFIAYKPKDNACVLVVSPVSPPPSLSSSPAGLRGRGWKKRGGDL
jgi:hypothetical protein